MATKVHMEALSPTMEEGRLVKWAKKEGDAVKSGETLAEVETDKAVMELVARADGQLLKVVVPEGTTVPVGNVVAWIGKPGEKVDGAGTAGAGSQESGAGALPAAANPLRPLHQHRTSRARNPPVAPADATRVKASPLARRSRKMPVSPQVGSELVRAVG
jgi:pyruvate/2-oxoglutarate dehydrogenase complex dihydrolipoamide acyltransferase (E2) component